MDYLIPGEIITEDGFIELNSGKNAKTITVSNTCLLYTSDAADE